MAKELEKREIQTKEINFGEVLYGTVKNFEIDFEKEVKSSKAGCFCTSIGQEGNKVKGTVRITTVNPKFVRTADVTFKDNSKATIIFKADVLREKKVAKEEPKRRGELQKENKENE